MNSLFCNWSINRGASFVGVSLGTALDAIVLLSRNVFLFHFNIWIPLGAPAQSFLGAYALARLPLNINLVSLGAPAQSFLGAYALARLPLTSTWFLLELRPRVSLEPLPWQDSLQH